MDTKGIRFGQNGELIIDRIFEAPRELVFRAWTDPELFMRWWGPKDFTSPFCKMDFRVGGRYHFSLRSPDGKDYWSTGEYREIVPPSRLVFTDSFADDKGNAVPASYYGMEVDWPEELVVTLIFEEVDSRRTRMILTHTGMPPGEVVEMTGASWNESFDKLQKLLNEYQNA